MHLSEQYKVQQTNKGVSSAGKRHKQSKNETEKTKQSSRIV